MRAFALGVGLAVLGVAGPARASEVAYTLDLADRAAHRLGVAMVVRGAPAPLELRMPAWTPGAYELRTWGRNVTLVSATDAAGRPLTLRRTGPGAFRVEGHAAGGEVRVVYAVHAALLSDDASQLDAYHAYLNGTSVFLSVRGLEATRHLVSVAERPGGWRAATTLDETPSGGWEATGYEALVDAPIELGAFAEAEVRAAGRIYRVALHGAPRVPDRLLKDLAALAEAEARVAGPPPYRRYLVLIHLADGLSRMAALEHAASTSIVIPRRAVGEDPDELTYVLAHELFHAWNARRLRPPELRTVDYDRPTTSRALWITEGLAEHYAHRAMLKSGRWSRARYLDRLGEEVARALEAMRRGRTLEEDAELAFTAPDDAAEDPDAYYARGHLVALALDATIRLATQGRRSLDDVVRALLTEADRAGGPLAVDTERFAAAVEAQAGAAAGQAALRWARERHPEAELAQAIRGLGVELRVEDGPPRVVIGLAGTLERPGVLRVEGVAQGSPAARAGLQPGDRIVAVDGRAVDRAWADTLARLGAGRRVAVEAFRQARRLLVELDLEARRPLSCRVAEAPAPPAVAQLRAAWLAR